MKITAPPTQYPTIYDRNPISIVSSVDRPFSDDESGTYFSYQVPENRLLLISLIQFRLSRMSATGNWNLVHLWLDGVFSGNFQTIANCYLTSFNPLYEKSVILTPNILFHHGDIFTLQVGITAPQDDLRLTYSIVATEFDA